MHSVNKLFVRGIFDMSLQKRNMNNIKTVYMCINYNTKTEKKERHLLLIISFSRNIVKSTQNLIHKNCF